MWEDFSHGLQQVGDLGRARPNLIGRAVELDLGCPHEGETAPGDDEHDPVVDRRFEDQGVTDRETLVFEDQMGSFAGTHEPRSGRPRQLEDLAGPHSAGVGDDARPDLELGAGELVPDLGSADAASVAAAEADHLRVVDRQRAGGCS